MKQYFDCPLCFAKNQAYRSETYPEVVVHKCETTLKEVGFYTDGHFLPINKKIDALPKLTIETNNFFISKISSLDEFYSAGDYFENYARKLNKGEEYLKKGIAYTVSRKGAVFKELYMIYIEDNTIKETIFFSGKNYSYIPYYEGKEIIEKLISEGLISHNPFPRYE